MDISSSIKKTNSPLLNWDICGHKNIVSFLQSALINQKLVHAYLFIGPGHLGKKAVAQKFIGSIFCQTADELKPCGKCLHCRELVRGIHPDFYSVRRTINQKTGIAHKDIVIDQIRDLKNKLQQATLLNHYKIALIDGAEHLNPNAFNALLKILEEPTPKTVLILLANNHTDLPKTIISRCQIIHFLPVATKEIKDYLRDKINHESQAQILARLAGGRPGLALSFWHQPDLLENYFRRVDYFWRLLDLNLNDRLELVNELIDWQKDETLNIEKIDILFETWQSILRDLLLIKTNNEILISNLNQMAKLKESSLNFPPTKIKKIMAEIITAKNYFKQNINSRLILENLIINL